MLGHCVNGSHDSKLAAGGFVGVITGNVGLVAPQLKRSALAEPNTTLLVHDNLYPGTHHPTLPPPTASTTVSRQLALMYYALSQVVLLHMTFQRYLDREWGPRGRIEVNPDRFQHSGSGGSSSSLARHMFPSEPCAARTAYRISSWCKAPSL